MNRFSYVKASTPAEAAALLSQYPSAKIMAGGTDLLPLMKGGLATTGTVIDLSAWKAGAGIEDGHEGVCIGAMTSLASIASNPTVRTSFTALADACGLSAAPQLRNMGTIGGNLLQQTRCWYYRGEFNCWLKGGETCYARSGENEQHAIFNTDPGQARCVTAHPSDPAAALLALDASVEYVTAAGTERVAVGELFAPPTGKRRSFTTLPGGAVITAIIIDYPANTMLSAYRKVMPRATWAFALAGVAIALTIADKKIGSGRVALSGVAQVPVRIGAVEDLLAGAEPAMLEPAQLAAQLTATAQPLSMNAYKVDMLQGLFRQTLSELLSKAS
jgi:xanthine dehydrogenase YagS FAD-binding subunit